MGFDRTGWKPALPELRRQFRLVPAASLGGMVAQELAITHLERPYASRLGAAHDGGAHTLA
jgi:hypothetical protein